MDIDAIAGQLPRNEHVDDTGGSQEEEVDDPMEIETWGRVPVSRPRALAQGSSIILITNDSIGAERRVLNSQVASHQGLEMCSSKMDQSDIDGFERLECCVLLEINRVRSELRLPHLDSSQELRQAGKSESQFYTGNCLRQHNHKPFWSIAFAAQGMQMKQGASCARKLARHWSQEANQLMNMLTVPTLKEIGVGVWGCSESFVVTIVMNEIGH